MGNFRQAYHSAGGQLNKVLMGIGITKEYLLKLKGGAGEQVIINDCIHNCVVIEESALRLEQELADLKKLSYRLMNPDTDFQEITSAIESANRNVRIFVVDDDQGLCDIIQKAYVRKGFQVDTASSKEAALQYLENSRPDLVLLDLYLQGGREGEDILRAIKAKDAGIRTIVVTYEDQEEKLKEIRALGPDDILTKPVRGGQLEAKINGLVTAMKGEGHVQCNRQA